MKIGFFQFEPIMGDVKGNLLLVCRRLREKRFDLMVLPELFSTGYPLGTNSPLFQLAEKIPEGPTTTALCDLSMELGAIIVGSVIEKSEGAPYITAILTGPEGYLGKQRKREHSITSKSSFSSGVHSEIFMINDISVGIAICVDGRNEQIYRYFAKKKVKIICHPTAVCGYDILEGVRNNSQKYSIVTLTANQIKGEWNTGIDIPYVGHSQVVGIKGEILKQGGQQEEIGIVDIDIPFLTQRREERRENLF